MKLTKPKLSSIGVINAHDYAQDQPFIYYSGAIRPGWYRSKTWKVHKKGVNLNVGGPWYNYNDFVMDVDHTNEKDAVLEKIKAWASQRFEIKEWEKTIFGTWMDKEFVEKRNKELEVLCHDALLSMQKNKTG